MEEWDPQKMLDLYIHDYLVRKNMHTTAEVLAKEADIHPTSVVINPPEGFLLEWWSIFWDSYSSRLSVEQASTSKPTQNAESAQQNGHPVSPVPDVNYMLQSICPTMGRPGLPNLLQTVNPTKPTQNAESVHQNGHPFSPVPNVDYMLQTICPTMGRPGLPNLLQTVNPTTMPTQNAESVQQNGHPFSPVPDVDYTLQTICPTMGRPGLPNLLQTVNPTTMPRPEMGSLLQNSFSTMMPKIEFSPNRFGPTHVSDNNMREEQIMADLVAKKVHEQERLRLPPRNIDSKSNVFKVNQLAHMLPSASSSSYHKKKVNNKRQLPLTNDVSVGTCLRRSTTSELNLHAPKLIQDKTELADIGRKKANKIPSEGSLSGFGYADNNTPGSNQQKQFAAPSAGDLAAQASEKLITSASESSTKVVSPTLLDDDSKEKGLQIGTNTETEKQLDEDIESFFADDEAPENMSISYAQTLPQSPSAQKQKDNEDFPFGPVRSLHPSNNKLSCCDFSTQGKFLAAAGHEKKVFIWNLKQSNRHTIQGHSQIITDIRFKPHSNNFATSSFDKSVKIWDAANPKNSLFNLVGHAEQVTSVDFHPRMSNLLCSCDCNDEIRLWNFKESSCFRSFKGANRQVRFQPRQGNLLAAVTGNVINLIDVETSMIQYRFEGHEKDVRSICWDVCGEYLVSASPDSTRVWSLASGGKCIHELHSGGRDFASCTFHPAYSHVVAVGSYQSIYIWNTPMGNKTWEFPAHQGIISAMANASETNMIASVSHDQWVKLWK